MIPRYAELLKLSDEELVRRFDKAAENTLVGTGFYLEELARRSLQRESARMLDFTRQIRNWTLVIVFLTVVNAIFVAWSIFQ